MWLVPGFQGFKVRNVDRGRSEDLQDTMPFFQGPRSRVTRPVLPPSLDERGGDPVGGSRSVTRTFSFPPLESGPQWNPGSVVGIPDVDTLLGASGRGRRRKTRDGTRPGYDLFCVRGERLRLETVHTIPTRPDESPYQTLRRDSTCPGSLPYPD